MEGGEEGGEKERDSRERDPEHSAHMHVLELQTKKSQTLLASPAQAELTNITSG